MSTEELFLKYDQDAKNTLSFLVNHGPTTLLDLKLNFEFAKAQQLDEALNRLTMLNLIVEIPSNVRDFSTYYPTPQGFRACTENQASFVDKLMSLKRLVA